MDATTGEVNVAICIKGGCYSFDWYFAMDKRYYRG